MNKKIISLFLAAAMLLTVGCSNNDAKPTGPVAYIENPPEGAGSYFDITYEEWHNEYLYALSLNGYSEQDGSDVVESQKQRSLEILIQERIVKYLAEQEGISAETLNEEDAAEIERDVQTEWDFLCSTFEGDAKAALGDIFTEEELYEKEFELFTAFMAESGLTPEIYYMWKTNELIQDRFIEKFSESIDEQTVKDFVQGIMDTAKDKYENDIAVFESAYTDFYVPEGTRVVQQIYVKLNSDAANEIKAYRSDGDDKKADELLEAAAKDVRPIAEEAYERLLSGEDWLAVQEEYNQDDNGNDVDYVVYPSSSYISQGIIDAAMGIAEKGGVSEIIPNDTGFFILYYKDDRVMTDEEMDSLMEQALEYLTEQESISRLNDFKEKYPYVYDYELMGISK